MYYPICGNITTSNKHVSISIDMVDKDVNSSSACHYPDSVMNHGLLITFLSPIRDLDVSQHSAKCCWLCVYW